MDCSHIKQTLQDTIGLNPDSLGDEFIRRVIRRRMKCVEIDDIQSYCELVNTSSDECEALIENIIIQETWFYRDRESFVLLRSYIQQEWFPRSRKGKLRILSCPCSTGEEPYSVAMTLIDAGMNPGQFCIDAVDISGNGLEKAELGVYGKESFRGKGHEYRDRYFSHKNGDYSLDRTIKEKVRFLKGNVLDNNTFPVRNTYHILFCKNLLIYLADEARQKLLSRVNHHLVPCGLLFVGHTEQFFFRQSGFELVKHPRSFACRKPGIPATKLSNGIATFVDGAV